MNGQQQSMDVKKILDGSLFFFQMKNKEEQKKNHQGIGFDTMCATMEKPK